MLDVLKRYAQSLREGLGDKHNFFLMITGKIKVVEEKSQEGRTYMKMRNQKLI